MTAAVAQDSTKVASRALYHIGLRPECPLDNVTAGGQALCKTTERVSFDRFGNTERNKERGVTLPLSLEEVDKLKAAVGRMAIRAQRATDAKGKTTATCWPVRVGEKRELARYKIDVDKNGLQTKTPIYESRRLKDYDPKTDEPLAPYVYIVQVEQAPGSLVPSSTLVIPDWAKPAKA